MAEKNVPHKKTAPKILPKAKGAESRERIIMWLIIAAAIASIWLLLAVSPRVKPLVCDGSHGGSLTSFGSCK